MPLLRTIGGRLRTFRMINRAVTHHGRRIAETLEERVNSLLPEERRIDFWLFMLAIVDLLRLRCDRLTVAEHDLVGERANDSRHQRDRDRDTGELRSEMLLFRNAFESNYLPANIEEFGFPPALSEVPFEALRQADYLVEVLSRPGLAIPPPRIGTGLPVAELVAGIKTLADRLRASLDATDREVKLAEFAVVDKDDAAAEWDELSSWALRTITGLFILAGRRELAAKVLPPIPRRGRNEPADGEGDDTSDDGAEGSDDPVSDGTGSSPPAGDGPAPAEPPASSPAPPLPEQ